MPDEKVEQAEIDAYSHVGNADGDAPTREQRLAYLRERYGQIRGQYTRLLLEQEEFQTTQNAQMLQACAALFKLNYAARRHTVKELRTLGETVADKFVPG